MLSENSKLTDVYYFSALQVTFKQTVPKTKDNTSFDKMDSDDSWETSAVTIEIDVAEELPVSCGTEKDEQGQWKAVFFVPVINN